MAFPKTPELTAISCSSTTVSPPGNTEVDPERDRLALGGPVEVALHSLTGVVQGQLYF